MRHLPDATVVVRAEETADTDGLRRDAVRGTWDDGCPVQSVWSWPANPTGRPPESLVPCLIYNRYPELEARP
jgi:hypothetical protein